MSSVIRYCLLGYHPANKSYSITRYFNFYRKNLPAVLGCEIDAQVPGKALPESDILFGQSRARTWFENYIEWPVSLISTRSECFHIVDQGLMWYAKFLRGGRRLGTVHDLIAFIRPTGSFNLPPNTAFQKSLIRESARQIRRLDHIISVSTYTADCLVKKLGIPSQRITVVPNHVDVTFTPPAPQSRAEYRKKWFQSAAFAIIHVGQPTSYKNRLGAIKAFARLLTKQPEARLFLVGTSYLREEEEFIRSQDLMETVALTGAVTNCGLREIYGAADLLLFPSFYEGFGWPPLEAMACGCPVISSTRASLCEVVGDAARTIADPADHDRIAELALEILRDSTLANELRARGLARARQFSPDRALNAVAEIYRSLA